MTIDIEGLRELNERVQDTDWARQDILDYVPTLLDEIKRLREENEWLREYTWRNQRK